MSEFAATMTHISQLTTKVNDNLTKLFDNSNAAAAKLPGFIAQKIVDLLKKLQEVVAKMWEEVKQFIEEPGNWGDLSDASKAWTEKVQSPVSAEAGRFTETYSKVDDYWQGRAAEAYKKVIKPEAPQSAATEQCADTAKEISSALNTCKLAIIGFWLAVGIAYSALIYTLIKCCVAAATGVGTLPALGTALGAIGVFLGAVAAAAWAAVQWMGEASNTFRTENSGNNKWPGGKWPPAGLLTE